jgi:4-hydroxybenzoate polyprenyltransferase
MSKADRLQEEIGWLKVAFAVAVALDASLVAWLAQNYETASPVIVGAAFVAALVIAGVVVVINNRAYRRIEELEDA